MSEDKKMADMFELSIYLKDALAIVHAVNNHDRLTTKNAELKRQRDEAVELITLLFVFITKINDDIMNGSEPWHDEKPENWDNIHDELGIKHKTVKQFLANLKEVKDGED